VVFASAISLVLTGVGLFTPTLAEAVVNPDVLPLARQAAAESIVLLKNDNQVLPLTPDRPVSVFGRVQVNTFFGGYGSGSLPNADHKTPILTGLRANGGINLNETLASTYESWCASNPISGSPLYYPEMSLTNQQVADAAAVSDTAIVVIGRAAGEGSDTTQAAYHLQSTEITLLDQVTSNFDKVVVIVNIGNVMDLAWVEDYPEIDAVLVAWQGGMETGPAVADVLSGDVTPSGHLTDTFAYSFLDFPARNNFGASAYNNYAEDIFVGYRYFETFAKDKVQFPFGYGLSYTTFDIDSEVSESGGTITVEATVKNTGNVAGKEVVQVYYGAPNGKLGKAAKSLVAYAKTNTLRPGKSEKVTLAFDVAKMSSYDDGGYTIADGGNKSAWVLEAGDYPIYVGDNVRAATQEFSYNVPATYVTEQLTEALAVYPASSAFDRWRAVENASGEIILRKTGQQTPTRSYDLGDKILADMATRNPDKPYNQGPTTPTATTLLDVYNGTATLDDYMAQLDITDLVALTSGGDGLGIGGRTSIMAGVTNSLRTTYGAPVISTADGPAGMRISATTSQVPSGAALAATWNDQLVEDLFKQIGQEMLANNADVLLAPGMNIHRDPLCGRNFEYFSEDPVVTGRMASAVVKGVQSQGLSATPKHFAANNQETSRSSNDSRVSERALREIYLKGFEIVVKEAKPQNIMMSYNRVNSVWSHYNYQLANIVLRDQWGFDGVTMTDWTMTVGISDPEFPEISDNSYRIRAGVDILKPGAQRALGDPAAAVAAGDLNVGEVQTAARHVLEFALKSARFRVDNGLPLYSYTEGTPFFTVDQPTPADARLDMIYVDGQALSGFDPGTLNYSEFLRSGAPLPVVSAAAGAGLTVQITQPTATDKRATIVVATSDGTEQEYKVSFSDQAGLPIRAGGVVPELTGITVDGTSVSGFDPGRADYSVWVANPAAAVVAATTAPGVTATQTRSGDVITIRAESDDGARLYRVTLTTSQSSPNLPQSDEFDGTSLQPFWSVTNQTSNLSTPAGSVVIRGEAGDWYSAGSAQHNVVYQKADGDWTAIVKIDVDTVFNQNYQQAGVMVYDDADNYLQFVVEYNSEYRFGIKDEKGGTVATEAPTGQSLAALPGSVYMRVDKNGTSYDFYRYMHSAGSNVLYGWTKVGSTHTASFSDPKFALLALTGNTSNTSTTQFNATYDWVRFSIANQATTLPPSDEFNDASIGSQWTITNQTANYSKQPGSVQVISETGEYYTTNTSQKNTINMPADGDWVMTSKMSWDKRVWTAYQQIGFMIYDDSDNFAQNLLEWNGSSSTAYRYSVKPELGGRNNGGGEYIARAALLPAGPQTPGEGIFRIVKQGFHYNFSASFDDGRTWVYMPYGSSDKGDLVQAFANPKLGLMAIHPGASSNAITVNWDYVRFTPITAKVRTIYATGNTQVKAYEDAAYLTSTLAPETTSSDTVTGGKHIGYTTAGEYALYDLDVEAAGYYTVTPRIAMSQTTPDTQWSLTFDNDRTLEYSYSGGTGGWQAFADAAPQLIYLTAGHHSLKMTCLTDGFNIASYTFALVVTPVDRSGLETAISTAKSKVESDYTTASWADLATSLAAAEAVEADLTATQTAVDNAKDDLNAKIAALDPIPTTNFTNTTPPVISFDDGDARYPGTATVSTGVWDEVPGGVTFQWYLDGSPISGATSQTYALQAGDIGHALTAKVSVTGDHKNPADATSAAVTILPTAAPIPTVDPAISGTVEVGQTLSVSNGTWPVGPGSVAYQWQADGVNIAGATASTYTLTIAEYTKLITVELTVSNPNTDDAVVTTAAVGPVISPPIAVQAVASPAAIVTGSPAVLSANQLDAFDNVVGVIPLSQVTFSSSVSSDVIDPATGVFTATTPGPRTITAASSGLTSGTVVIEVSRSLIDQALYDLDIAIDAAQTLTPKASTFTDASWAALQSAVTAGQALISPTPSTSVTAVDAATQAILTAMNNLVLKPAPVNKDALVALLAAANTRIEADYTAASWATFNTAKTSANTVNNNASATQTQVNNAVTALNNAIAGLVRAPLPVNKEALTALLASANTRVEADYTPASWTPFETARSSAIAVANNAGATQAQVDAAVSALQAGAVGLVRVPTPSIPVSKTSLDSLLTATSALVASDYSSASWAAYEQALASAELVSADPAATQNEVDAATASLQAAVAGLTAASPGVSSAALDNLASLAGLLSASNYTADSWATLQAVLATAQSIASNPSASQPQVDSVTASLKSALAGLVPQGTTTTVTVEVPGPTVTVEVPGETPKAAKVTTKSIKVTTSSFKKGSKPRITVAIALSSGVAKGKIAIYVGGKKVKTVKVINKNTVITLPKKYSKAIKVKAKYLPKSTAKNGQAKTSATKTVKAK
jgi:beta-glucosidase-like glycosyl hydrolase/regulation of enolase protein 1 (concanavalin A-like superfamily)